MYRLTTSTVEGRDGLDKSQSLQGFGKYNLGNVGYIEEYSQGLDDNRKSADFPRISNAANIDKQYGNNAYNNGLPEGGSFAYGEPHERLSNTPYQIDGNKNIKVNLKGLGSAIGPSVPQQEYKFVKEISGLVLRLARNSPYIGATNVQESMEMRELNDLQRLEEIFQEYPVSQGHFMQHYGLTGLIDILEQTELPEVKEKVLQVINTLTLEDPRLQEKACLFGILPYIIKYACSEYPKSLRIQAARYLGKLADSSGLPFQMFLASGGFKALAELLDIEYEENRDLVGFAVEMLSLIFERKVLQPQHISRILLKFDVFQRLMIVVASLYKDAKEARDETENQEAQDFLLKALTLMYNFAKCDDGKVKDLLGQEDNLHALTLYLRRFQEFPQMLSKVARILRYLSSEPSVLGRFENTGLLNYVLKLISKEKSRPSGIHEEVLIDLLKLLVQMCQLNGKRQDEVVEEGGVEVLVELKRKCTKTIERYVSIFFTIYNLGI